MILNGKGQKPSIYLQKNAYKMADMYNSRTQQTARKQSCPLSGLIKKVVKGYILDGSLMTLLKVLP